MAKKKVIDKLKRDVDAKMKKAQKDALTQIAKAKKEFAKAEKKIKATIKKNPVQSALVATTIASAIATAVSFAIKKKR